MLKRRISTLSIIVLLLIITGVIYYRYYFVFGDGTKAGTVNYFVHKGYVFKTYEGRLIQAGFKSPGHGAVQSNEFMFSVTDEKVARQPNASTGVYLEFHCKEYFHTLKT